MTEPPSTTTSVMREVALLLMAGATPDDALAVVRRLHVSDELGRGALGVVMLAATRSGVELPSACRSLASGGRVPSEPSTYEARAVRNEVGDLHDLDDPSRRAFTLDAVLGMLGQGHLDLHSMDLWLLTRLGDVQSREPDSTGELPTRGPEYLDPFFGADV
ncbi:MAG: hypothetical protein ACI867_001652 [Glaciecola sp.]|jgi:hypothetical protein